MSALPLAGVRIVELGQLIAGPFAGMLLASFGADVIKVEPLAGDAIRSWRVVEDGTSLWWRALARNKRCIAVDLRRSEGQDLVRSLCAASDVLLENFRPGTLERWGLDPAALRAEHPRLVVTRVSGYGQSGPRSHLPGYASVCEAFAGLRHVTGMPGEVPVRSNLSLGDTLAGLHAALGTMLSLYQRDAGGTRQGQVVDVSIFESVFNCLESTIPEVDRGVVRQASGTTITGVVPTGTYRCSDGKHLVVGANNEPIFARLCDAMDRPALKELDSNEKRVAEHERVEGALREWLLGLTSAEACARLEAAAVPCSPINDAQDIFDDPHFRARQLFETVSANGHALTLPRVMPRLETLAETRWPGPDIGAHTEEVLKELLALDTQAVAALRSANVIA